jgi:hypothetical protein
LDEHEAYLEELGIQSALQILPVEVYLVDLDEAMKFADDPHVFRKDYKSQKMRFAKILAATNEGRRILSIGRLAILYYF